MMRTGASRVGLRRTWSLGEAERGAPARGREGGLRGASECLGDVGAERGEGGVF